MTSNFFDQLKDLKHIERIGAHSHIKGLGVSNIAEGSTDRLHAADGMVGQWKARRAASLIVALAKEGKISGRGVLLAGKPGTGKTAIAMGIAQSLSEDVPFVGMSASEIYSHSLSKTEALTQALRKSVGVRIREVSELIQGEVIEISVEQPVFSQTKSASSQGSTGKITLRTTDMEAVYDLGGRLISSLRKDRIGAGDVICIDKASGRITKLGRSFGKAREFDASGSEVKFVPVPEGELQQTRTNTYTVSLHDIDVVNSSGQSSSILSLFSGDTGEVRQEVRDSINTRVRTWIEEGKCEIVPGVLFIDEVHMLDVECFSFLNRAIEGSCTGGCENGWSPLLVMASNRSIVKIRGTNFESPHGIPPDFLDRLLIISTQSWTSDEIREILKIRAAEEDVQLSAEALDRLVEISIECAGSLRYAMQLIMAAHCARARRKAGVVVDKSDIERVYGLFLDVKRSSSYLTDGSFMQF